MRTHRITLAAAALLCAVSAAEGQDTTRAKAIVTQLRAKQDSIARISSSWRVDSIARVSKRLVDSLYAALKPAPVVVVTPPPKDTTPVKDSVTPGAPPGTKFTHPIPPPSNGALLAILPRDTVNVAYPTVTRVVRTTNPQAALDSAKSGDEIRVPPGTVVKNIRWPASAQRVVLRTDVTLGGPWERMTKSRAALLNLATITTTTSDPALTIGSGVRYARVMGMRIVNSFSPMGALVAVGQMEADTAQIPHFVVLDGNYIDCGDGNHTRRGVRFDAASSALINNSILACRDSAGGDSQGVLIINTPGPGRIENNTIQGGHQSLMFGGGDPAAQGVLPRDYVIRLNDFCRPTKWLNGGQVGKAVIEWKFGERHLFEYNTVCNMDASGQYGYAVNLKSTNQDGRATWSTTRDVTFRFNKISCVVAGWSVMRSPDNYPVQPTTRVSIYGNVGTDSIATPPCAGPYDALTLSSVDDVIWVNNHFRNVGGRACVYFIGVSQRFVATDNVCGGEYDFKGDAVGWQTLTPGALVARNTLMTLAPTSAYPPVAPDSLRDALLKTVKVVQ